MALGGVDGVGKVSSDELGGEARPSGKEIGVDGFDPGVGDGRPCAQM